MDGQTDDGWMNRLMNGLTGGQWDGWMNRQKDGLMTNRCMNRQTDGQMDGQVGGHLRQMDGWMKR